MRLQFFGKASLINQWLLAAWRSLHCDSGRSFSQAALLVIAASMLVSCSETEEPLNARAGRIPPEALNEILQNRYAATSDIQQQLAKAGGRLKLSIDLSYSKITDEDLKLLKLPAYLTHLNLEATAITDEGVSHLLGSENLEILDLGRTEITENCLETLRKLPGLKQVDLNGTGIPSSAQLEMVRFLRTRQPKEGGTRSATR